MLVSTFRTVKILDCEGKWNSGGSVHKTKVDKSNGVSNIAGLLKVTLLNGERGID
jgi:hypothetical protein